MARNSKFNGFENWIIVSALAMWTEAAEEEVAEANDKSGGRSIYAPGYFSGVTKELAEKVNSLTYKKDLK